MTIDRSIDQWHIVLIHEKSARARYIAERFEIGRPECLFQKSIINGMKYGSLLRKEKLMCRRRTREQTVASKSDSRCFWYQPQQQQKVRVKFRSMWNHIPSLS